MPRGFYKRNQSGWRHSPETKEKMSLSAKGNTNGFKKGQPGFTYWKGKKMPLSLRKKLSDIKKGKVPIVVSRGDTTGFKNYQWKENKACYRSIHKWVQRWKGKPNICEMCGKEYSKPRSIQWANIDHTYRRVLEDYIALCCKCHKNYDKTLK
jgi:hypothetical protein